MSAEPCRVAVLISGSGTNLQSFIDHQQAGNADYVLSHVFSNRPDAYGLTRAQQAGIPADCIDHTTFADRTTFDQAVANCLDAHAPDLLILAGYMRILSEAFVDRFAGRILNIHPALLPLYPGLDTHERVLAAGDRFHGSTVHFVTAELDGGPRILQGRLEVGLTSDADELRHRVQSLEHVIYPRVADWFAQGRLAMRHGAAWLDDAELVEPVIEDF